MNTYLTNTWVQSRRAYVLAAIAMIGIGLAWPLTLIDDLLDPARAVDAGELWGAAILAIIGLACGGALLSFRKRIVLGPEEVVVERRVLGFAWRDAAPFDQRGRFSRSYETQFDTDSYVPTWFIRYQWRGETLELCRMKEDQEAEEMLEWLNRCPRPVESAGVA